jgi:hypothetical protein
LNVTEAITQVLERTDNVPATAAENATRRQRLLEYLIEEFEEVYDDDWKFRRRNSTVTIPANQGWGLMPADFGALGKFGSVWLRQNGRDAWQLSEEPESVIDDTRRQDYRTDAPRIYSIFDQDETTAQLKIQVPTNTAQLILSIYYLRSAPTLDESANVEKLKLIPPRWHQAVLIPRLRARARESKGDVRWKSSLAKAAKNELKMKGELMRDQGRFRQMPGFFGGWR